MAEGNEYIYVRCEKLLTFQIQEKAEDFRPMYVPCPSDCPRKRNHLCWKRSFFVDTYRIVSRSEDMQVDFVYDPSVSEHGSPYSATEANDRGARSARDREDTITVWISEDEAPNEGFSENDPDGCFDDFGDDFDFTPVESVPRASRDDRSHTGGSFGFGEVGRRSFEASRETASDDLQRVSRSIFADIKSPGEKPCFIVGGYLFYERIGVPHSAGNAEQALQYIFYHWLTSRVFQPDKASFKKDFLLLLKLRGLDSRETEIVDIAGNRELSVNQKFFRLFYQIVYDGKRTEFFWHERESLYSKIIPLTSSREDFYRQLLLASDPGEYIKKYQNCMNELFMYLSDGKLPTTEDPYEWFKQLVTLRVATDELAIIHITGSKGTLNMYSLGSIDDFVESMCVFDNNATRRRNMLNFLRKYRITPSYHVEVRGETFIESTETEDSDDSCIYAGMGISRAYSSVYATVYNEYATVLKEYMDTFKPEQILIGVEPYTLTFTKNGFRAQLEGIVRSAGQYLDDNTQSWYSRKEVVKYYMTRSLLIRGVLNSYIASSEYLAMENFVAKYYRTRQLNRHLYFSLPASRKMPYMVTLNGNTMTFQFYVTDRLKGNGGDQDWLCGDTIVNEFIEARKEDKLVANSIEQKWNGAVKAMEEYTKILSETEG